MGKRINSAVWLEKYGRWQINVQKDGQRKTFSCSTPGRAGQRECQAKADAWLDDGIEVKARRVEDVVAAYLEDCKSRTSLSNYRGEEYRCRVWVLPQIGKLKLDNLGEQQLQKVITTAYAAGKSEKTLKNIRATLMALCKFARRSRWTTFRPEEISIPASAPRYEKKIVQPDDLATIFSSSKTTWRGKVIDDPFINAYRLQIATGLRPGELLGLMRSDRQGNVVHLSRAINVFGEITQGKNQNANRTFILTPTALSIWEAQEATSNSIYLFPGLKEDHYRHAWRRYCEHNKIPYVPPYNIRHTFVSMVQSLPEGWVKILVGHSKSMDTFGTYAHATVGLDEQIAAGVQAIFSDVLKGCL
ncbi:tyrosine-type recombinase/integrase [Angelakisella massiliensis]|uniref:tyrosine-type recombinase/integrase n=1 Tax=Angelakisella massiliensis TaxID=1871018 RepID=UPI0024B11708|nr:tyrosine-type recombinase/integrase [Angelakisella massiliensis]